MVNVSHARMGILMTLSTGELEFEVRASGIAPYPNTRGDVYLAPSCHDEETTDGGYVGDWDKFVGLYPQFAGIEPPPTWHEVNFGERAYSFPYRHIADVSE